MKHTKIITLAICVLLLTGAVIQSFAESGSSSFSDVRKSDWFAEIVGAAADRGVVSGYPDGSFRPDKQVSYAEFLAMSMNLEKLTKLENPSHWAETYYRSALSRGIISESDFAMKNLDSTIPREHMALILAGLINARDKDHSGSPVSFSDISGNAYADEITLCSSAGVLSGYPDGTFRPDGALTRSEAAAAVLNYLELLDSEMITGGKVIEIYENGNFLTQRDDGTYRMYYGHDTYMEVEAPDPNEDKPAKTLMREDQKAILDQVLASAKIYGTSGNYTFTYTQPQIPDQYHFAVDLHIYKQNSEGGDDTVFFKNSDEAWMRYPENYDPSAKTVTWKLDGVKNIEKLGVIFRLQIFDILDEDTKAGGEDSIYIFSTDYDGSYQLCTEAGRFHNGEIKYYTTIEKVFCPAFCW